MNFGQNSSCWTFNLNSDFVSLNISNSLILLNPISDFFIIVRYGSFTNRVDGERKWEGFDFINGYIPAKEYLTPWRIVFEQKISF